jgi:hypothetical protein
MVLKTHDGTYFVHTHLLICITKLKLVVSFFTDGSTAAFIAGVSARVWHRARIVTGETDRG